MEAFNKQTWEDLNLSRDEVNSIGQALKQEEFRNLLVEYVEEINDPNNRKQYEEEITQLENERGVDVKFIHPTSGYVIKTSVDGKTKAFINICTNNNVGVPFSSPNVKGDQRSQWSIPYCLAPPRDDLDKKKKLCVVYDVVFHPDTLALGKSNIQFKKLVNDTALEGVEENFNVSLDKVNLKFPKMQFKGLKHPTVIRKKIEGYQSSDFDYSDIPNCPYPSLKNDVKGDSRHTEIKNKKCPKVNVSKDSKFTIPNFTIKHRSNIEMENFTNDPLTKMTATVPNELEIVIELPLLKSASDASVDITENKLILLSEKTAKYKLDLKLPYSVDRNRGCAKFDISKKVLVITLPVVRERKYNVKDTDISREDSGFESDNGHTNLTNEKENSENVCVIKQSNCLNSEDTTNDNVGFLNPNLHYSFPNYSCKYLEDVLHFVFQVSNINPDSVKYCFLNESSGFHMTFVSLGAGFFPVNYAVYFKLPPNTKINNGTFRFEVSDGNIDAQVKCVFMHDVKPTEYYLGTDHNNTEKRSFPVIIHNTDIEKTTEDVAVTSTICGPECKNTDAILREDLQISDSKSSLDEGSASPECHPVKSRTVSESQQGDDNRNKYRGILKIGRSLSESRVDEYASWSDEKNEKCKKTVRFSDIISKQVFRMNSSILGQRKKNQRKTRNKKRAQERRLSESGNESEGDVDFDGLKSGYKGNKGDICFNEPESSSCDVSEVSDVSDISESDDGQRENEAPPLPCSSRKNHKRRGKKSARKSAATAKFNYIDY